jgi:hypothetical protein
VFGALDAEQREMLYQLLQQATAGHVLDCIAAIPLPDEASSQKG